MTLPVALPRRGARQDPPRTFPPVPGGATGTIATPSRVAAREGTGAPERPNTTPALDGARGAVARIVAYLDNPWSWSAPGSRRNATPIGYGAARYVRQSVPNVGGIVGFATAGDARTPTTTNAPESGYTIAASAVPFSRRRIVSTFAPVFDASLWTNYLPRAIVQKPQAARRMLAGPSALRTMRRPSFPNLTVLAPTTTYGAATATLTASGPNVPGAKLGRTGAILANAGG